MNPDFAELLRAFIAAEVRYLIVGAYALGLHGRPRATGDLDIWVEATPENAERLLHALAAFGAPLAQVTAADFSNPGLNYQIGQPPVRIDILTALDGVRFGDAWPRHATGLLDGLTVNVISRADLVQNKRASGRTKDRADLESLGESV